MPGQRVLNHEIPLQDEDHRYQDHTPKRKGNFQLSYILMTNEKIGYSGNYLKPTHQSKESKNQIWWYTLSPAAIYCFHVEALKISNTTMIFPLTYCINPAYSLAKFPGPCRCRQISFKLLYSLHAFRKQQTQFFHLQSCWYWRCPRRLTLLVSTCRKTILWQERLMLAAHQKASTEVTLFILCEHCTP